MSDPLDMEIYKSLQLDSFVWERFFQAASCKRSYNLCLVTDGTTAKYRTFGADNWLTISDIKESFSDAPAWAEYFSKPRAEITLHMAGFGYSSFHYYRETNQLNVLVEKGNGRKPKYPLWLWKYLPQNILDTLN